MELPAQAIDKNRELKDLVLERGLTPAYLTRKCKEVVPEWRLCPLPEKKAFSPEQKRERMRYSAKAALYPLARWQSTVFIDEHLFFRRPEALPTIHLVKKKRRFKRRIVTDKRKQLYKFGYPKMHFMYAVHWKLGVLGPYWISDTTGWSNTRKYKVCAPSHRPPTRPPTFHQSSSVVLPSFHSPRDVCW